MANLPQSGVSLVAEGAQKYFGDMKAATQATDTFSDATEGASRRVSGAGQVMIGALREFGAFTANMFAEAGKAAIGFVSDSIDVAGDFESGMNRFQSAAGDALEESGAKLEDFHDLFIDIGKELPVSTGDVQDAAIELVKGGLDPMILKLGGLKDAIQFAAASELGLEEAATIAVKQLGVWTEATATAEEQTAFLAMSQDMLVKAAGASTLNVDKLAASMNIAGGQAKALDLDYRDFATGITLISPAFNSAEEAGTGYKNFLARIQPTTAPATEAMQELGLWTKESGSAFFDAQGNYIGNAAAAEMLQDATAGLTNEQKASALQTIFGNDAMGAAVALAQAGGEGYDLLAQKIDAAAGVQATAAAKQEGFKTAMDNFKGSIEALQITLGEKFLPILTDVFNNTLSPAINTIGDLTDAVSGDQEAFAKLSPPIQTAANIIKETIGFVSGLVEQFKSAQNPIDLVTGALGFNSDTLADLGMKAQEIASGALQSLQKAWREDILPALNEVWNFTKTNIVPILEDLAATVLPILGSALKVLAGVWENVLKPALALAWAFMSEYVVPVLADVAKWLKENLPPAIETVANFLNETLLPSFKEIYGFIQENVLPILGKIGEVLKETVGKAMEAVAGLWQKVLEPALSDLWDFTKANLIPILQDAGQWLDDVTGGFNGVKGAIQGVLAWLDDLADSIANLELPDWLTPGSPTPLETALYGLADAFKAVLSGGLADFAKHLDDVNEGLRSTQKLIADVMSGKAGGLRTQADNIRELAELQGELDPQVYGDLKYRLDEALKASQQFTDPRQAADYYDLLSKQAFEFADLQTEYYDAVAKQDKERMVRLSDQMLLIDQAQQAEREAFKMNTLAAGEPFTNFIEHLSDLMDVEIHGDMPPAVQQFFDNLSALLQMNGLPGFAQGGGVKAGQMITVGERGRELFVPQTDGWVLPNRMTNDLLGAWNMRTSPAASAPQITAGGTTNYTYGGPTYNLGVTTNQSPAVVQQNFAIMQATAM